MFRASRPALPVMYPNDEKFEIGKAKIVRQSDNDQVICKNWKELFSY